MIRIAFCLLMIATAASARAAVPATMPAEGFRVTVDGAPRQVELARIAPADAKERWLAMDDADHPAAHFDQTAFVSIAIEKPTKVSVHCRVAVAAAVLLPAAANAKATVTGHDVSLTIKPGQYLTLEINGDITHALHLFADASYDDTSDAHSRKRDITFAPGVHYVKDTIKVTSGQTVDIAEGAVLYGVGDAGPVFQLTGDHITFRGRGIIDGSMTPRHSRHLIAVLDAQDVTIDGVTLRDCSTFNLPVRRSDRVTISNVKIFGSRANSDGIDICNSRDVVVDHCFVRTLDDLIVVKGDKDQGPTRNVNVTHCVLWNQVAHALSIGAEIREPVDGVTFKDCDVIHDTGREWTLRVFNSDAGRVSNVRFENIRVADSARLISLWIGKAVWSRDAERGHIDGVTFQNITCGSGAAVVDLQGADPQHAVKDVTFDHVTVGGKPLDATAVRTNAAVTGLDMK